MTFILHWVDGCSGPEQVDYLPLSVGTLVVTSQSGVITQTDWDKSLQNSSLHPNPPDPYLDQIWLDPTACITLTLRHQGSPFRNRVWQELCQIPCGTTLTYAAVAKKIGSAARAVGNACRDNPYPLLIPCHRVVSAAGPGGYCGQTNGHFMDIKTRILAFEAMHTSV